MNDYEMMNQRVDQLRLQLADVAKEQLILNRTKETIMTELLDTRRQITRADKIAHDILGRQPVLLEGEFPKGQAPVDLLDL